MDHPRASTTRAGGNTTASSSGISPASSFQMSYPVLVKVCNVLGIHRFSSLMYRDYRTRGA
jgi:hypothetical protein